MKARFLVLFLSVASLEGCGYRELKTGISPSFQSIQANIVQPKCLHCHESLATYEGLLRVVEPGSPEDSEFYEEIQEGGMPLHSVKLSDAEIQAVHDWIQNGAQND